MKQSTFPVPLKGSWVLNVHQVVDAEHYKWIGFILQPWLLSFFYFPHLTNSTVQWILVILGKFLCFLFSNKHLLSMMVKYDSLKWWIVFLERPLLPSIMFYACRRLNWSNLLRSVLLLTHFHMVKLYEAQRRYASLIVSIEILRTNQ